LLNAEQNSSAGITFLYDIVSICGLNAVHQFACRCGSPLQFSDRHCGACGDEVGFDPRLFSVVSLAAFAATVEKLHFCDNARWGVCNWVIGDSESDPLCLGCRLNNVVPNMGWRENQQAWIALEQAKKHLIYQILRLRLPIDRTEQVPPLRFDFVDNALTGHLDGLITVNLNEANPIERERQRQLFGEPHRTLVGHMRHESGHYFWMRLIEHSDRLVSFRKLFGDERQDYAADLSRHHTQGPPANWRERHVSAYASSHPWEDWAETWAHYLHMVEALDTAHAMGVRVGNIGGGPFDAYAKASFPELIDRWRPLTVVMNGMNRALGLDDFYPFTLSPTTREKMAFVHDAIRAQWTLLPTFGRSVRKPQKRAANILR
jgi:hypothetical protein